ncbi:hypothetical protein NLJ89_g12439 [Agrocybe chaxingu]|uniref:Uncharacterized protein n=1 Tax=Agrocybe chaxingu TaxID=84603 RepID=A0A9W8JLU8_9AGAR|nr:hypothetical protein NLJ89_g12439 [Agrocybe chaxingu]
MPAADWIHDILPDRWDPVQNSQLVALPPAEPDPYALPARAPASTAGRAPPAPLFIPDHHNPVAARALVPPSTIKSRPPALVGNALPSRKPKASPVVKKEKGTEKGKGTTKASRTSSVVFMSGTWCAESDAVECVVFSYWNIIVVHSA